MVVFVGIIPISVRREAISSNSSGNSCGHGIILVLALVLALDDLYYLTGADFKESLLIL